MTRVLEIQGLSARYGRTTVLHGISLAVEEGQIGVLLGANGAGKTTTLRAVSGLVARAGSIRILGKECIKMSPDRIARLGVAHVPEGRGTFSSLTVEENLWAGAVTQPKAQTRQDVDRWFSFFPRLHERRTQLAGSLSGGEQQMLAIARAMMLRPALLLLDEPSMGLAPNITQDVFAGLREINAEFGTTMFIVEQNVSLALNIARNAYILEAGNVTLEAPAEELKSTQAIQQAYLGSAQDK